MIESKRRVLQWGLVLTGGSLLLTGCGGGGGETTSGGSVSNPDSTASGKARVSGNVAQNDNHPEGRVGGIRVFAGGSSDTTDSSGQFDMRDVEPGSQPVTFESERNKALSKQEGPGFNAPVQSSIVVNVPADGSVEFRNVRIRDDIVVADEIIITTADDVSTSRPGGSLPDIPEDLDPPSITHVQ